MAKTFVAIVMGSDSDLSVMKDAAVALEQFGINSEIRVLSAHRVPEHLVTYIRDAEDRGCKVFIAGAGVAAALPGTIAAHTALPVIGVPLTSASSAAGGLDALLSIVQMPPGVPVATVGLNSAKNAGILAAQIIGAGDEVIRAAVVAHKEKMTKELLAKDEKLQKIGYKKYLEGQA
ncbi:MAG TPA: 5-(carboxyamino)imidazole ribonucleotide mutase [Candidatus Paceibacterota bacterium]